MRVKSSVFCFKSHTKSLIYSLQYDRKFKDIKSIDKRRPKIDLCLFPNDEGDGEDGFDWSDSEED